MAEGDAGRVAASDVLKSAIVHLRLLVVCPSDADYDGDAVGNQ